MKTFLLLAAGLTLVEWLGLYLAWCWYCFVQRDEEEIFSQEDDTQSED